MKSEKKISTTILLLLTVSMSLLFFLLPQKGKSQSVINRQPFKYFVENVMPVMRPYRVEFAKQLTEVELVQIDRIRNELKDVMEIRRKAGVARGLNSFNSDTLSDTQVDIMKNTRKRTFKALFQALLIANNHEKELQSIFMKEERNLSKWSSELSKLILENSDKRIKNLNPVLVHNIQKLSPIDHMIQVLFIIWEPDSQILSSF